MARIDSLLSILAQQGADELRLGTDREPKMLALGTPKRLSISTTPEGALRELLGEIVSADRERTMRERGHAEMDYVSQTLGSFKVKLSARSDGGFDVVLRRDDVRTGAARRARETDAAAVRASPNAEVPTPTPTGALAGIVANAAAARASDVHLADGRVPLARVDGRLVRLGDVPVDVAAALEMDTPLRERLTRGGSSDVSLDVAGVGRARVHAFATADGLAAAVRLLPGVAPSLASLGLPVPLDDLIGLSHGLVVVCGATGSGKSTTLAALAQEALRRRSIVLVTLEDPIEHGLAGSDASVVRRRQVGRDVPDFSAGLRDALREDPDVILVGEMRDPETIGLALTAAETGHLVLSSLHSGSAASAVERIVDAYPPARHSQVRVQLADVLRAVVAQRLLARSRGSGRVVACEVLRGTHAVGSLIREGKTAQIATAIQSGRREGMIPLERSLADRVLAGEVSADEARNAANDPDSLAMYLAGR
jgi:twitching motility protein PilT